MNILAVGAHGDDIELGCGGSLAKHAAQGDKIFIYMATTSGGINPFGAEIRNSKESLIDAKKAADILGAQLINGSFPVNQLNFDDALNSELIKIISEKKIDLMYTHWSGDVHHDHRMLARASLHAGRHLNKILMYQSNWYRSDEVFLENFYVDISDTWGIKEKLLQCYESEMKRTNGAWITYNKNRAENYGFVIGVKYAEAFQCVKWSI
ncbi:MAG: hypothetical protein HFH87_04555 [Lachnospiraceae bacterium]|nr:hypothetical protein [Lachnospiraceae bacterium]